MCGRARPVGSLCRRTKLLPRGASGAPELSGVGLGERKGAYNSGGEIEPSEGVVGYCCHRAPSGKHGKICSFKQMGRQS
jgi:hypothetical protein